MILRVMVISIILLSSSFTIYVSNAQGDYFAGGGGGDGGDDQGVAPPPQAATCNGVFLSYEFESREKEYPHLKNATAQAWAFKSTATIMNTGIYELKAWKLFIGFQHKEILVSASNAVLLDGSDFPAPVGNGTQFAGSPQADLKTSIDTAGDLSQIQAEIKLTGTQFGVKPPGVPMPKTIRLENDGFKCPGPTRRTRSMHLCCVKDPKFKVKLKKTKFYPRQKGDLSFTYDIIQTYPSNYLAQVTLENNNPLSRLDHWNLTWEWMRGEFIYTMRGAYTHLRDYTNCIYGLAAQYYGDLDFSQVMNCQKKPIIADLPAERAKDEKIANLPHCCRNGSLMSPIMNETNAKNIFQLQVYKLPPDLNRTALYPPEKWKIVGDIQKNYRCGAPLRVSETEFPDPSGLQAITLAIASWQIVCNMTHPKKGEARCCVTYSGYYNESVVPCNTCACGCDDEDTDKCSTKARALLLPPEALLVPFVNRTAKALAWSKIKHHRVPRPMPCGDNCGVSVNWHINTNYRSGWSARITLFNWEEVNFEDWFVAVQLKKAGVGYEKAYSFNGTLLKNLNNTIFLRGLPGLNYLMGEVNGTHPSKDPRVPGKQQSVISFTKKHTQGLKIVHGDGFPSRLYFNGEECALPTQYPVLDAGQRHNVNVVGVLVALAICMLLLEINELV